MGTMRAASVLFHKTRFSPIMILAETLCDVGAETYSLECAGVYWFTERTEEMAMRRMFGFMIGIIVGGLIGSTVALLLAPDSGEQMRAQLRARGEGLLADVRQAAESRRVELTGRLESLRAPRGPRPAAS